MTDSFREQPNVSRFLEAGPRDGPPHPATPGMPPAKPGRPSMPAERSGAAQDSPLADARRDPPRIEEFQQRNRIFPGDPEQILDVAGADLLALAQQRDELFLDRLERFGVEEQRFLHADQPARLEQHLEEVVLLVAAKSRAA